MKPLKPTIGRLTLLSHDEKTVHWRCVCGQTGKRSVTTWREAANSARDSACKKCLKARRYRRSIVTRAALGRGT